MLSLNVYEAFEKRLAYIFEKFDHIIVSFSGGKDSGLLLELVQQYVSSHKTSSRVSVFHLDYEGNYQKTKDYVLRCMGKFSDFDYYHVCLPISASCGASMFQPTWLPWNPSQEKIWVGVRPKSAICLENHPFDFFDIGMSDYEFQKKFCLWLHAQKQAKRTAVLVGIRAQESLQRYHAVTRNDTFAMFGTVSYSRRIAYNVFNFYPLYDWKVEDVWTANARYGFDYNELYDLFYQAGLPLKSMRVANPFHECGIHFLKLYRVVEPETWGKLLGRVNGANFSAIYGGTKAMGYRSVSLPHGHTWHSYLNFLMGTLPEQTRNIYSKKFRSSRRYWLKSGGSLPIAVIEELKKTSVELECLGPPKNRRRYRQVYEVVRFKEYPDDIQISSFRLVPSYKRMCICILKNDTSCRYMGFSQTKDELQQEWKECGECESCL